MPTVFPKKCGYFLIYIYMYILDELDDIFFEKMSAGFQLFFLFWGCQKMVPPSCKLVCNCQKMCRYHVPCIYIYTYHLPIFYTTIIYIQLLGISVYSRNFLRTFFMGTKPPSTGWCFPVMRTLLCKAHEYHMVIVDINYIYSR